MRSADSGTSRSGASRILDGVVLLTGFLALGGVLFSSKRKGDGADEERPGPSGAERPDHVTRAEDGSGALEAAEYRTLIEGLPLVTYINRLDGETVFISPQVEQLLGFPAGRWLSEPEFVKSLLHPEDKSRVEAEAERARTSNQHFLCEYRLIAADGTVVSVLDESVPVTDERGRPLYRQGYLLDTSEQREAAEALKLSEEKFRSLVSNIPAVIYRGVFDGDWMVEFVSDAVEAVTGYPAKDWTDGKQSFGALVLDEDRDRLKSAVRKALATRAPYEIDYRLTHADGSVRWVCERGRGVYSETGDVLWLDGVVIDQTAQKQLEEELAHEQSLLRIFLENTPDAVYFKDAESRFLRVSRALATKHGLDDPDEVVGKTDFDYFSEENAQFARDEELAIMESGKPVLESDQSEEWEDGRVTYASVTKMPLKDENGDVVGTFGLSRDITQRKLAELALRAQAERMARVIETQRDIAAADLDLQTVMNVICERTQELTKAGSGTILLLEDGEFVHRAATGFMADKIGARVVIKGSLTGWCYERGEAAVCEDTEIDPRVSGRARRRGIRSMVIVPLRHGDETVGMLEVLSQEPDAFTDEDRQTLELLSVVLSSALSNAAEFEAKRQQVEALGQFRTIFEGASIGITRVGFDGRNAEVNPALEKMLGYTAAEFAELSYRDYTHPEDVERNETLFNEMMNGVRDSYTLEKRCFRKDGELVWWRVTAALERDADGQPKYTIAMIEDITERKVAEEALRAQAEMNEYQALHDALTGLPNRTLFHDRIHQAILTAEREGGRLAVLMMDLDRFKEINDTLGHHSGDALLKEVAGRLRGALRASDTVARLGGDEFGVLLPKQSDPADVVQLVEKIRRAVEQPIVLQGLPLGIEASIGVSFYPDNGRDVDTLLQRADVAMYTAKEENSSYAFYNAASDDYDPARLTLVGELRRAIDKRELVLYYQPKAVLKSGDVGSVEALLRWQHPKRGLVPPDDFIPLAQQTGLMKPLTLYVIDEALKQCRTWQKEGLRLSVAVNLSTRNLLDVDFPDDVAKLLDRWEVDHELLELEITESTMLADPFRTKVVLDKLSAMGVRLSIDDFGTGYSSLAYLKRLPVNEIKIDRSFVMNMNEDEDDAVIVRSTIDLGRNLGLEVVAEGVENEQIWNELESLGCHVAQGYYLSRPVPPDELSTWVLSRRATAEGGNGISRGSLDLLGPAEDEAAIR